MVVVNHPDHPRRTVMRQHHSRRCSGCGISLPRSAGRCPSCGHRDGDVVVVERGAPANRPERTSGPSLASRGKMLGAALAFALGALVGSWLTAARVEANQTDTTGQAAASQSGLESSSKTSSQPDRFIRIAGCGTLSTRVEIEYCYGHGWEALVEAMRDCADHPTATTDGCLADRSGEPGSSAAAGICVTNPPPSPLPRPQSVQRSREKTAVAMYC
jgi:hypothetical protein